MGDIMGSLSYPHSSWCQTPVTSTSHFLQSQCSNIMRSGFAGSVQTLKICTAEGERTTNFDCLLCKERPQPKGASSSPQSSGGRAGRTTTIRWETGGAEWTVQTETLIASPGKCEENHKIILPKANSDNLSLLTPPPPPEPHDPARQTRNLF